MARLFQRRRGAAVLILAASLCCSAGSASGSVLDPGFGINGRVVTNIDDAPIQYAGGVRKIATDAEGRIYVAAASIGDAATFVVARLTATGELDPSFSGDGVLHPSQEVSGFRAQGMGVRDDGAVIIGGSLGGGDPGQDAALARFLADGSLDGSFGEGGVVRTNLGHLDNAGDVLIQPGGQLVARGSSSCFDEDSCPYPPPPASHLLRYSSDGTLLSAPGYGLELMQVSMLGGGDFVAGARDNYSGELQILRIAADGSLTNRTVIPAGAGIGAALLAAQSDGRAVVSKASDDVLTRLGSDDLTPDPAFDSSPAPCRSATDHIFNAILPRPDDRLLLAGYCGIASLGKDGGVEEAFGNDGLIDFDTDAAALQPDGKILAAFWEESLGGFRLRRYLGGGTPDTGFGEGGEAAVKITLPTKDEAEAAGVQSGGRILAVGSSRCIGAICEGFGMAKYRRNGSPDSSFDGDGRAVTRVEALQEARSLALFPNGSFIAAGKTEQVDVPYPRRYTPENFALAKYRPSGQLDPSFGDGGVVITHASTEPDGRSEINAAARQGDGKVVVAGLADGCPNDLCFVVSRYRRDGKPDRSFGGWGPFGRPGMVRLNIKGTRGDVANAVAIQPNGRIVATGGGYGYYVTVRLMPNGRLDRSFGGDGIVKSRYRIYWVREQNSLTDLSRDAKAIVLGANGSITVAGGATHGKGLLIRYHRDGSIDRRFGHRGRVKIPTLTITDLLRDRCGLIAIGTDTVAKGILSMGVVGLPGSGPRRPVKRIRYPFGSKIEGDGADLVRASRSKVVAVGSFDRPGGRGDFALARLRSHELFDRCG